MKGTPKIQFKYKNLKYEFYIDQERKIHYTKYKNGEKVLSERKDDIIVKNLYLNIL